MKQKTNLEKLKEISCAKYINKFEDTNDYRLMKISYPCNDCIYCNFINKTREAILKDIDDYDKMIEPRQPECKDCIMLIKEQIKKGIK